MNIPRHQEYHKTANDHGCPSRDVTEHNLPIFFEHQLGLDATEMAAFPSRGKDRFMAYWAKIIADNSVILRTILSDGQIAGNGDQNLWKRGSARDKEPSRIPAAKYFCMVWIPGKYLHREAAPLLLTFSFPQQDVSLRWKEVAEPSPGRFTHHLERYSTSDIDDEDRNWLKETWKEAG